MRRLVPSSFLSPLLPLDLGLGLTLTLSRFRTSLVYVRRKFEVGVLSMLSFPGTWPGCDINLRTVKATRTETPLIVRPCFFRRLFATIYSTHSITSSCLSLSPSLQLQSILVPQLTLSQWPTTTPAPVNPIVPN